MNRLVGLICGVVLVLGACSSDSKKSPATTAATDSSATATSVPGASGSATTAGASATTAAAAETSAAPDGQGGAAAAGDPCSIVTVDDVAAAFGGTVAPGVNNTDNGGCDYEITGTTKTGDAGILAIISISLGGDYSSYDDTVKVVPEVVKVDGVGNGAWYYDQANQLHVDIGGAEELVISGILPGDPAAIQAEVIDFGKVVVAKLG